MRRFFTEPDNIDLDNGTLTIIDDAVHISKVLRMECGDKIIVLTVQDMNMKLCL